MDYSKALKEYREREFLTQTELAERLGVSFVSVNRWENGHFVPSIRIRRKLNELFKEAGMIEEKENGKTAD